MAKTSACSGFAEDYSAWLDGELEVGRAAQMRAHVDGCAHCEQELAALRSVDTLLRAAPAPAVHTDLRARLQARIAAEAPRTEENAAPAAGLAARDRQPRARPQRVRETAPRVSRRTPLRIRPAVGVGAAIAAAAALALVLLQPGVRDEGELPTIAVAETERKVQLARAVTEEELAPSIQVAVADPAAVPVEEERPAVPERAPDLTSDPALEQAPSLVAETATAAEETVIAAAEARPSPTAVSTSTEPVVAVTRPSVDPIADPIEDLLDLERISDREVIEIAVVLDLETLEDLGLIANLDLLERLIALEDGTG